MPVLLSWQSQQKRSADSFGRSIRTGPSPRALVLNLHLTVSKAISACRATTLQRDVILMHTSGNTSNEDASNYARLPPGAWRRQNAQRATPNVQRAGLGGDLLTTTTTTTTAASDALNQTDRESRCASRQLLTVDTSRLSGRCPSFSC